MTFVRSAMAAWIAQIQYFEHFRWECAKYGSEWDAVERRKVTGLRDRLAMATPFYIAPPIVEIIRHAAGSIPPWALRREDLLTPYSFIHWATPIPIRVKGEKGDRRADLVGTVLGEITLVDSLPSSLEGFHESHEPVNALAAVALFKIVEPMVTEEGHVHAHGLIKYFDQWAFGDAEPDGPDTSDRWSLRQQIWPLLFSLLAFLRQRIIRRERVQSDRASQKIAGRAGLVDRPIEIVTLRATGSKHSEGDNAVAVAWSCRWWVMGHWRQQRCGERGADRRPTWIAPYVKGPETKPMRARQRMFAVVR